MATAHRAAPTADSEGDQRPTPGERRRRRGPVVLGAAAAVLLIAAGIVAWHVRTTVPSVPYTDPAVTGRLTLCSAQGEPLTTGSIIGQPFAAEIVGGTAAAGSLAAAGRTATLLAAQPRAGVDAAEWSTLQLTPGESYRNPAQPAVRLDRAGTTLGQFLTAYPAVDGGWVQLRLVLAGIDLPAQTQSYAAVDLHISGHGWTVVNAGSANCPTNP